MVHSHGQVLKSWKEIEVPFWLRYLHFHEIKSRLGLSTASLIAFVMGIGCIAGALLVGLSQRETFVEWEAIQFYRSEWLLAATAAFVAGILLKKKSPEDIEDTETKSASTRSSRRRTPPPAAVDSSGKDGSLAPFLFPTDTRSRSQPSHRSSPAA